MTELFEAEVLMGYRELLKNYIRFLELHAGDNFIESIATARESMLSERDLGELRAIAAEIFREANSKPPSTAVANYNYRFRLLLNHYGIAIRTAALIGDTTEERVRCWRTQPRSRRYLPMTEAEFRNFETRLTEYLESGELPSRTCRREPGSKPQPSGPTSKRGAAANRPS
ncbi:MAG: hypothetical protein JJT88_16545 [Gammaproteobacteria bacterium]|nr:hypothetical protein [Gammaproteobacteria bacterium]